MGERERATAGAAASRSATSPDETATAAIGAPDDIDEAEQLSIGSDVGRYIVLEELGRGGMGRVLRAYDPKLQREVALKVLRANALDEASSQRLVEEARAMAKVGHPNVVAVYDVEELGDGRLVLVMELVAGATLREWLRAERPWPEVVRCFVAAGRGLAAAHAADLLHRDFKPANVLVTDDVVKVTDFGLAKTTASSMQLSADVSMKSTDSLDGLTQAGVVVGTPRYMAPEQHRGEPLTPAADQYAFCTALWEALCRERPFAGRASLDKKMDGPPPWPAPAIPKPIAEAVRRGLAPEPVDRWPSLPRLLEVLELDPDRRRRRIWQVAGAVTLAGAVGGGSWAWSAARRDLCSGAAEQLAETWDEGRRGEVARTLGSVDAPYAAATAQRAVSALDGYARGWIDMHTEACEATTVRAEQSATVMDLRMACLQRARGELDAIARVLAAADRDVLDKVDAVVAGLPPLDHCANTAALQAEVDPPSAADAERVGELRRELADARAQRAAGQYQAVESALDRARVLLAQVEYEPVVAEIAALESEVAQDLGDYETADARAREALRIATRWHRWRLVQRIATTQLILVGDRRQQPEQARRYRELAEGLLPDDDPVQAATTTNAVALMLEAAGDAAAAEPLLRQALALYEAQLGPEHPNTAMVHNNLGVCLNRLGRLTEAEAEYRTALRLRERALGPEHPDTATAYNNLGGVLLSGGRHAEAERLFRRAIELLEARFGPDHPDVASWRLNLALALYPLGKLDEAEALLLAAKAGLEKALGPDHPDLVAVHLDLSLVYYYGKRHADSQRESQIAADLARKAYGDDHPMVASALNNLGLAYVARGEYARAVEAYREVIDIRAGKLAPDHPSLAKVRANLSQALSHLDRTEEALMEAKTAWAIAQKADVPPDEKGRVLFTYAQARWAADPDDPEVVALVATAREYYQNSGELFTETTTMLDDWIAERYPNAAAAEADAGAP